MPGYRGGKLPGRSKEEGRAEEEEEGQQKKMETELILGRSDAAGGGVSQKAVFLAQGADVGGALVSKSGLGVEVGLLPSRGRFRRRRCDGLVGGS